MSSRVPIVMTDIGLPVTNKEVMLVSPKNPYSLTKAINKLLGNKELRREISNNAFKYAKMHSFENTSKELQKIIRSLKHRSRRERFSELLDDIGDDILGDSYFYY